MQHLLHSSIPAGFIEYLLSAGYKFTKDGNMRGFFVREKTTVIISHLSITAFQKHERDSGDTYPVGVENTMCFDGIDKLDFVGWVQLLGIMNIVSLADLISAMTSKEISSLLSVISRRITHPGPGAELCVPTNDRYAEIE